MVKLDSGNVLLKPSHRKQIMSRLRRSLRLGNRLGNFNLTIHLQRNGGRYEARADVHDSVGDFCCRSRKSDWRDALHELIDALANQLHAQCVAQLALA
jgi:ribosome-associated translation inhibitor RaiA